MKPLISFLLIIYCNIALGQQKNLVIADSISHSPIEYASVFYMSVFGGSISNKDGIVQLSVASANENINISHINYESKIVPFAFLNNSDTIFLSPIIYSLPEIVITKFNVRERFEYILKHYDELYVDYPLLKECTYKETFKSNNKYTRLFISDVEWWSKSSAYQSKSDEELGKICKIQLKNISVSKIMSLSDSVAGKGSINTRDFINRLYLNFIIKNIFANSKNILVLGVYKKEDITKLDFTTEETIINTSKNTAISFEETCYFNNNTKAITQLELKTNLKNYIITYPASQENPAYSGKTNSVSQTIAFRNSIDNNKLTLSYMSVSAEGAIYRRNDTFNIASQNILYVTKDLKNRSFEGNMIDISLPIHKNISGNIKNDNTVQLSKEELDFINGLQR